MYCGSLCVLLLLNGVVMVERFVACLVCLSFLSFMCGRVAHS